jgi:hypothetical protein
MNDNTKRQWKQGLQWGGVAWLAYILWQVIPTAVQVPSSAHVGMAAAWTVAAVLLLAGARVARPVLGMVLLAQAVTGTMQAASFEGPMHVAWALTFWLPMALPLLPLLFMAPERPRLTAALMLMGRYSEAWASLAGFRWPFVALLVVATNHEAMALLTLLGHDQGSLYRVPILAIGLLAVAAFPYERRTATAS